MATKKKPAAAAASTRGTWVTALVTLHSLEPMIQNPMSSAVKKTLRDGGRAVSDKERSDEDIAAGKLYLGPDTEPSVAGRMGFPTGNLWAALTFAGREVPYGTGKKMAATATSSRLPEFMKICNPGKFIVFTGGQGFDKEKGVVSWTADSRRTVNQATHGANMTVRPIIFEWEAVVEVRYRQDRMGDDGMKLLFVKAGEGVGLGDFRPQKKGEYGTFKVTKWEITKVEAAVDNIPATTYAEGVEGSPEGRRGEG